MDAKEELSVAQCLNHALETAKPIVENYTRAIERSTRNKFNTYFQQWKNETRFSSSLHFDNHNYQNIIPLGMAVVPIILEYIEKKPEHLVYALKVVTGENPCRKEDSGNVVKMCESWVEFGKKKGWI